jgi:hypothetical protein
MVYADAMTQRLVLHTPMPLMPLTTMVADMGQVMIDDRQGKVCCFYGWGEVMASPASCLPHHLVASDDNVTLLWMARTLKALGIQVVVTDYEDWSEVQSGVFPLLYDDAHSH